MTLLKVNKQMELITMFLKTGAVPLQMLLEYSDVNIIKMVEVGSYSFHLQDILISRKPPVQKGLVR